MSRSIRQPRPSGQVLPHNRPDLALVVGSPGWAGRVLTEHHADYPTFWYAWRYQGSWDHAQHEAFWRMNLGRWPRASKQRASVETVERAAALVAAGAHRAEVERQLGYSPGGLSDYIWSRARALVDFATDDPPVTVHGLVGQASFEQGLVAGYLARGDAEGAERVERKVRECWRTPRVVEADDPAVQRDHHRATWTNELDPRASDGGAVGAGTVRIGRPRADARWSPPTDAA